MAVSIPSGISPAVAVRAMIVDEQQVARPDAQRGRKQHAMVRARPACRPTCGITSPTQPTMPQTDTAAAVIRVVHTMTLPSATRCDAEGARLLLAHGKHVEPPAQQQQPGAAHGDGRQRHGSAP